LQVCGLPWPAEPSKGKRKPKAVPYFDALLRLCVWGLAGCFSGGALIRRNDFCGEKALSTMDSLVLPYLLSGLDNTGAEYEHASEETNP